MGICLPIRPVAILCMMLAAGCAADPVASDATGMDTKVALLTTHGPTYPPNMEKLGETGTVSLDCTITRDGRARDCKVVEATNQQFTDAAKAYIAEARYQPATRGGMPVAVAHHTISINFRLSSKPLRLVYDCSITPAGRARDCHIQTPTADMPSVIGDIVLAKLESLPVVARQASGRTVEEAHRAIEVLLRFQPDPRPDFQAPSMPVQTQVNLFLACKGGAWPHCREIPEIPFSTELQPYENDRFAALSIGFNDVLPTPTAAN